MHLIHFFSQKMSPLKLNDGSSGCVAHAANRKSYSVMSVI